MPTIQPFEPGKLASPLVGVAGKNPQGEALREVAANIDQTKHEMEQLRGVHVEGLARLRGAQLSGLSEMLGAGVKGVVAAGENIMAVRAHAARVQDALQRTQGHALAGVKASAAVSAAAKNWAADFEEAKSNPYYQQHPEDLYTDTQARVYNGTATTRYSDGSSTAAPNPDGHDIGTITQKLKASEDNPYDSHHNPMGDSFPQYTTAETMKLANNAANDHMLQAAKWVREQSTNNSQTAYGSGVDDASVIVAGTHGGLDESVRVAAAQKQIMIDHIQTDVNSGALSVDNGKKMIRGGISKINYAAALAPLANINTEDPVVAYQQLNAGLQALTTETHKGISLPLNLDATQKEHAVNLYRAAISQSVTNIGRSTRLRSLAATGGIVSRIAEANLPNNRGNRMVQEALAVDAQKGIAALQGHVQQVQEDDTLPPEAKDAIIAGDNAQMEKWLDASKIVNQNLQFNATQEHNQTAEEKQAAHDAAIEDLYVQRQNYLKATLTNTGANADAVTEAAEKLIKSEQSYVQSGVIKPHEASTEAVLNTAAATTKFQMKQPTGLLGALGIGAAKLVEQPKKVSDVQAVQMKGAILKSNVVVQGLVTAHEQDARIFDTYHFNALQKASYLQGVAYIRAKAQKEGWASSELQLAINKAANIALQANKSPASKFVAPPVSGVKHVHAGSKGGLVPAPPPEANLVMTREQWEEQGRQQGWR